MEQPAPDLYHCPACGELVAAADQRLVQCPRCGEQFFLPDPHADEIPEQEGSSDCHETKDAGEEELSELRIRQVASLRRGAYRARSWCVIAAGCCLIGAAQLVQMTIHSIRHGGVALPIGFCLAALAALMVAGHFVRRTIELTREVRQSSIPEPTQSPDFSTLNDGTQQLRALSENTHRQE